MSITTGGPASQAPQHPSGGPGEPVVLGSEPGTPGSPERGVTVSGALVKILLLGVVGAIAVWAAFPLIDAEAWIGLGVLVATTAAIFYIYLSRRHIPVKYLVPGT